MISLFYTNSEYNSESKDWTYDSENRRFVRTHSAEIAATIAHRLSEGNYIEITEKGMLILELSSYVLEIHNDACTTRCLILICCSTLSQEYCKLIGWYWNIMRRPLWTFNMPNFTILDSWIQWIKWHCLYFSWFVGFSFCWSDFGTNKIHFFLFVNID